jgi:hypothetical protein
MGAAYQGLCTALDLLYPCGRFQILWTALDRLEVAGDLVAQYQAGDSRPDGRTGATHTVCHDLLLLLLLCLYVFHVVVIFFVQLGILHVIVLIVVLVNIGINFNIGGVVVVGLVMVGAARSDQSAKLPTDGALPAQERVVLLRRR